MSLPARFETIEALEDFMTTPTPALVDDLATVPGDILVLGVGGKMGPTLARMAKRAAPGKQVIGVARFSEPGTLRRERRPRARGTFDPGAWSGFDASSSSSSCDLT